MEEIYEIDCGKLSTFLNSKNNLIFSLCANNGKIINIDNNEYSVFNDINFGEELIEFSDIVISPNDEFVIIIAFAGAVLIWDLQNKNKFYPFNNDYRISNFYQSPRACFFYQNNELILGDAVTLYHWDIKEKKEIKRTSLVKEAHQTMSLNLDSNEKKLLIYFAIEKKLELNLLDVNTFEIIEKYNILDDYYYEADLYHGDPVLHAEFCSFNNNLVYILLPKSSHISILDLSNKKILPSNFKIKEGNIIFFKISNDKSKIITISDINQFVLYDINLEKIICEDTIPYYGSGTPYVSVNNDNTKLVFSSQLFEDINQLQMVIYDIKLKSIIKSYSA